jgi:hypothetical protein
MGITVFPKVICPECKVEVLQLSTNKIFECCNKKFMAIQRPDGFVIKEVAIHHCRTCRRASVIVKKVY